MQLTKRLEQILTDVLTSTIINKTQLAEYFTLDYQQWVDNKTLNFSDFVKHIQSLKAHLHHCEVSFDQMISEDNKVHSSHTVTAQTKAGENIKMKVVGLFIFAENKLQRTEELTCLLSGPNHEKNIGSR
ncbi:hypothetical protein MSP8887_04152 [Marinomonas spartinae]|uniref:SnoaL-like domain protein n=1 Tax=Marinomonas spartinae TaxID=1792290 RepID=A0A1A8T2G9_9GAMM|nr:hypothetical protein [Marinomonas spartinae]SBS26248.1 hypothetical protein MSP8886_00546 [Marinomonas spartinae]SBS40051.1 hypothetical protein MSP8887_04152 [Marinomonas spartinae]